jgi:hypothetical protein
MLVFIVAAYLSGERCLLVVDSCKLVVSLFGFVTCCERCILIVDACCVFCIDISGFRGLSKQVRIL